MYLYYVHQSNKSDNEWNVRFRPDFEKTSYYEIHKTVQADNEIDAIILAVLLASAVFPIQIEPMISNNYPKAKEYITLRLL